MTDEIPPTCRYCRHELQKGAILCVQCKKFQNWQRYVGFSSTMLALVIALISVSSAVLPGLIELLTPARTQYDMTVIEHREGQFVVLAKNSGNRDVTVGAVQIEIRSIGTFTAALKASGREVRPGATRELVITYPEQDRWEYEYALGHYYWRGEDSSDQTDKVPRHGNHLSVEVIGHKGCKFLSVVEIPEPVFMAFLQHFFPNRRLVAQAQEAPEKWEHPSHLAAKTSTC